MNTQRKPRATFRVNPNDPPPNWPDEIDPNYVSERTGKVLYVLLFIFIGMWAVGTIGSLIAGAAG